MGCKGPCPVRGFTLVELLVVISVIALLMGAGYGGFLAIREQVRRNGTKTLLGTVALAVNSYPGSDLWQVASTGGGVGGGLAVRSFKIFDWNGDQILDGYPEAEGGDADLCASGYRGAAVMCNIPLRPRDFEAATGRILDAWGSPLRVARAARIYGDDLFGVWSLGPDRSDGPIGSDPARDNLVSWKAR